MKKRNLIFTIILLLTLLIELILCCFGIFIFLSHPIKYTDIINKYSTETDLNPSIIQSVINVESSYKTNAISSAGAIGLMQIMPTTAEYIATKHNIEFETSFLENPDFNIHIGCLYIRYLLDKFKNEKTSLVAYNAGETIVRSWLKNISYSQDGITLNYIPYKESREYVSKIYKNFKYYSKL